MKIKNNERKLYIPSKVNLTELISAKYDSERYRLDHQDKYAYVLSKIIEQKIFSTPKRNGLVALKATTLRDILGADYYKIIVDDLLEWGVIISDNHYEPGVVSRGFDISMAYQSKAVEIMILKDELARKLQKRKQVLASKPESYIRTQLKNIEIRHQEALQYIDDKYGRTIQLIDSLPPRGLYGSFKQALDDYPDIDFYSISLKDEGRYDSLLLDDADYLKSVMQSKRNADFAAIRNIVNRNFCFKPDDVTGRVYTFITNLSRSLRQFLYHRKHPDTPLVNIDIRNSQPFIFCSLLVDYYRNDLPEDVQEYIDLCSEGKLYNVLMSEMNFMGDRKAFKQMLFATLFYCTNHYADRSKDSEYFRSRFPNVYAVIKHYKAEDYKLLSRLMQTTEADIMIKKVVNRLMRNRTFVSTIHDSVLTLPEHANEVVDAIKYYFNTEYGIVPSLEVEQVTKREDGRACIMEAA
ncbi:hypothetical protein [Pontibacter chinhatensis]|uniref:Uncharacterized protein n=1 Tax=Pontibacter chinhatensis TaxID=1436961 RepID=A0A1I2ZSL5_9BACT|nr:hypothetical protein [Pontibacter chinhatensis]SFH40827.1 hypothetical protein SAMN05421739_11825 [Pontibacter chinhatensis]